jgi:uncharacterized protein (DUF2342 family)
VTHATLGPTPLLDEAQRRRRRTEARGADGAAALMGVNLRGARVNVADEFVERIVATAGTDVLATFFRVDGLPSSAELANPTAWLERVANSPFA